MTPRELAELAKEVDVGDPTDFGMLLIKEDEAFLAMSEQVIDLMKAYNPADRQYVAMASLVKLLVENFVLNLQLMEKKG